MNRRADMVAVDAVDTDVGSLDRFTSVEIVNDLTAPSEASFEIGDDSSWSSIEQFIRPGSRYKVTVNGRLRLTGRVEANDCPVDASGGATVRFVVRTKLADASYASASPTLSLQNATLKDVVLRAYKPLGFTESDFIFRSDLSRDLMTGKSSKSGDVPLDLSPMELDAAKVSPPETIYEFVERHLTRFHLSHWDSPDGRIVVGVPNDLQDPLYCLQLCRGSRARGNNVLSARRVRDISDAPSTLAVTGVGGKYEYGKSRLRQVLPVPELSGFHRPVIIVDESLRNQSQVLARARRELTSRVKRLDCWELVTDGLSFWDGHNAIPFGVDTVADLTIDTGGGAVGAYLVHRVVCKLDPDGGFISSLSCIRRGLWRLDEQLLGKPSIASTKISIGEAIFEDWKGP